MGYRCTNGCFSLLSKQLRVRTYTYHLYHVGFLINPNQKKIVFYMTLHAASILTRELMGVFVCWQRLAHLKTVQDFAQLFNKRYAMTITFEVFLCLSGVAEFLYLTSRLYISKKLQGSRRLVLLRTFLRAPPQWLRGFLRSARNRLRPRASSPHSY